MERAIPILPTDDLAAAKTFYVSGASRCVWTMRTRTGSGAPESQSCGLRATRSGGARTFDLHDPSGNTIFVMGRSADRRGVQFRGCQGVAARGRLAPRHEKSRPKIRVSAWHPARIVRPSGGGMKAIMLRVAGLTALAILVSGLSVAPASASGHVSISVGIGVPVAPVVIAPPVAPVVVAPVPVPRPVVVAPAPYGYYAPAPYPGYVWRPAYYVGYRYVPGAWVRGPYGAAHYHAAPHYHYHR